MKNCPYCKEQIHDDAVRCRYCSSWLDSANDRAGATSQTVVYVVDRGLVQFAKFSLSILALFLVVGAFFYGFDLKQAAKEIQEAKQQAEKAKEETQKAKAEVSSEGAAIAKIKQDLSQNAQEAKSARDEILGHRDRTRVLMATIQTPLDEARARLLFKELVVEHLSSALTTDQLARIRETLEPRLGELSRIVDQPSLALLHVRQAIAEVASSQPVTVAILADRSSSALQELRERFVRAKSFVGDDPEIQGGRTPSSDHTTAVASIVAAIAPHAKIMPIAVLGRSGVGFAEPIAEGVKYAVENDARIIVMPFGSSHPGTFAPVFQRYSGSDVLFIASAGNTGSDAKTYPAAFPNVLAVATTDDRDEKAPFSSYGSWVGLAAPGVDIQVLNEEGKLVRLSGGSFSTAVTGGVATLVLTVRPKLKAAEVTEILKRSSVDLGAKNPTVGNLLGSGRIDALAAVTLAKGFSNP
jgi:Subtilase family